MIDNENNPPQDDPKGGQTVFHTGQSELESGRRIPTLLVMRGKNLGEEYVLRPGGMVIGRTMDNDIYIPDARISRQHAKIIVEETDEERPPKVVFLDLSSTNGSKINDEKVDKATLNEGDKIMLGETLLRFNLQDALDLRYQSQIKSLINIDNLTKLFTKRTFDLKFEQSLTQARPLDRKISVLMMDLDHFKQVNDDHDHLFGSYVLHEVGKIIKQVIDPYGVSGRYGGEEFVSFLPNIDKGWAKEIAEKLRTAIEEHVFVKDNDSLKITISIGVSTYPVDGDQPDRLIQKADHALYRAKHGGRNLVLVAGPEDD